VTLGEERGIRGRIGRVLPRPMPHAYATGLEALASGKTPVEPRGGRRIGSSGRKSARPARLLEVGSGSEACEQEGTCPALDGHVSLMGISLEELHDRVEGRGEGVAPVPEHGHGPTVLRRERNSGVIIAQLRGLPRNLPLIQPALDLINPQRLVRCRRHGSFHLLADRAPTRTRSLSRADL
jgi:hypothetical protein